MRLGHIHYLNSYPLYWGMLEEHVPPSGVELVSDTPAGLNQLMRSGKLDLSLVSSACLPDIQSEISILSDYCIASIGTVHSVLLFSRYPLERLDGCVVGLTAESETSVVLLRYLLESCRGLTLQYRRSQPGLAVDGAAPAAVLRIGNDALMGDRDEYPYVYDLGSLWYEQTGLPMVYAVFALRTAGIDVELLQSVRQTFAASLARARADEAEFFKCAAAAYPSVKADLPIYYDVLKYDFTDVAKLGLRKFFDVMEESALLPAMGEMVFV